jgi:hypothetical protein
MSTQPYDQQALELCEVCGWKTLIPTEGCLNCERQPKAEQRPQNCGTGFCSCIECPYVQPKAEQEPVLYVHPSTYAMESANQIGVWRPGCQLDDYLPLYFAPPAPQPRRNVTYVCPACHFSLERQE